jgi:hypothetical protein
MMRWVGGRGLAGGWARFGRRLGAVWQAVRRGLAGGSARFWQTVVRGLAGGSARFGVIEATKQNLIMPDEYQAH